jgi:hypothetical protein
VVVTLFDCVAAKAELAIIEVASTTAMNILDIVFPLFVFDGASFTNGTNHRRGFTTAALNGSEVHQWQIFTYVNARSQRYSARLKKLGHCWRNERLFEDVMFGGVAHLARQSPTG